MGGYDIEHNKYCGQISTIIRALASKDGDFLSHFDKIDESEVENEHTSLHHHLINNHDVDANKGKIKGQLPLEHIFGFCRVFKKITEQLGFHLILKTANLQHVFYTTICDDIKVIFDNLFLFVQKINPDAQTQIIFNSSIKNSFTSSFDSWSTDRKTVHTNMEYQVDVGSARIINSPNYLIVAHQTADRIGVPNKAENVAVFDNLNVRKYRSDYDGVR